ncbi:RNA-guided endonuclease InsQ/TnpB family protein [Nonomuraea sp. NPDC050451]|uniref:RNA-guided endonuclease InsQ/TnpB family protein n=1 Tax=Nonomuraea sp. NPDC050451 TaxID=3364364 RepID=UPI0037AAF998
MFDRQVVKWPGEGVLLMLAGRRYRLEFDFGQRLLAERVGGICRSVWNTALEQRRAYRQRGTFIGYTEQCRQLSDAKTEFGWLAEAPSQVLQQVLKDLDRACAKHGVWKVRWKSRTRSRSSFRFPAPAQIPVKKINRKWGRVYLPKFGWTRFRMSRPERVAGVDRGVVTAAATSDGEFFDRRHATCSGVSSLKPPIPGAETIGYLRPGEAERYLRLQRQLARTGKGSHGRKTAKAALGQIMRRVRQRRADFNAQTAHRLTARYSVVILEELNTRRMTMSVAPKPDPSRPGSFLSNGAGAKSGLNRAILDKGWYGLQVALLAKARYTGSLIVTIDPAYTSQTCSVCQKVDTKSRKSQALFTCTSCGDVEHADVNAAKNIKARWQAAGLVVSGRGDSGSPGSLKRQASRTTARGTNTPRAAAEGSTGILVL